MKILRRERSLRLGQGTAGAIEHNFAAVFPPARAKVDHVVGPADDSGLVLDNDQRVAEVPQFFEQKNQPLSIAWVQPDARLVQHIKHIDEFRPKAGREVYALGFAP